jgi:hypothetical protein
MFANGQQLAQRLLGAVDLAIDAATLGEYGLAQRCTCARCSADGPGRERRGPRAAWEASTTARPRGECFGAGASSRDRGSMPRAGSRRRRHHQATVPASG